MHELYQHRWILAMQILLCDFKDSEANIQLSSLNMLSQ